MSLFTKKETVERAGKRIYVEGYKGVSMDMKGYGGFHYEVGVTYHHNGPLKLCESGFHFSPNLTSATFYKGYKARYFKVEALVEKDVWGTRELFFDGGETRSRERTKYVSPEITLLEEIPIEEVYSANPQFAVEFRDLNLFKEVREYDGTKISFLLQFVKKSFINHGYSPSFASFITEEAKRNIWTARTEPLWRLHDFVIMFAEEGISPDIRTPIILKKLEELKDD